MPNTSNGAILIAVAVVIFAVEARLNYVQESDEAVEMGFGGGEVADPDLLSLH